MPESSAKPGANSGLMTVTLAPTASSPRAFRKPTDPPPTIRTGWLDRFRNIGYPADGISHLFYHDGRGCSNEGFRIYTTFNDPEKKPHSIPALPRSGLETVVRGREFWEPAILRCVVPRVPRTGSNRRRTVENH